MLSGEQLFLQERGNHGWRATGPAGKLHLHTQPVVIIGGGTGHVLPGRSSPGESAGTTTCRPGLVLRDPSKSHVYTLYIPRV